MNKTYRKVFNSRRGTFVAVAENVAGHGQMGTCTVGGQKPSALKAAVVAATMALTMGSAVAEGVDAAAEKPVPPVTVTDTADWVVAREANLTIGADESKQLDSIRVTGEGGYKEVVTKITVTSDKTTYKARYETTAVFDKNGKVDRWSSYYDKNGEKKTCTTKGGCTVDQYKVTQTLVIIDDGGKEVSKTYETSDVASAEQLFEAGKVAAEKAAMDTAPTVDSFSPNFFQKEALERGEEIVIGFTMDAPYGTNMEKETGWEAILGEKSTLTNDGELAVSGNVNLDSNGHIVNNNSLNVTGALNVTGNEEKGTSSVTNNGTMSVAGGVNVEAGNSLSNAGKLEADISGSGNLVNSDSITAGKIDVGSLANTGSVVADSVKVQGGNNAGTIEAGSVSISKGGDTDFENTGVITSGSLNTTATNVVNKGQIANEGSITVSRGSLTNEAGAVITNGDVITVTGGKLSNSGVITSGSLNTTATNVVNKGQIANEGSITVSGGSLTNEAGAVITNGDVITVTGGKLSNSGEVTSGSVVGLVGTIENNQGGKLVLEGGSVDAETIKKLTDSVTQGNEQVGQIVDAVLGSANASFGLVQAGANVSNSGTITATGSEGSVISALGLLGKLENNGTATFDDVLAIGATVNNNEGATLTADAIYAIAGSVNNAGTAQAGTFVVAGQSTNSGELDIAGSKAMAGLVSGMVTGAIENEDAKKIIADIIDNASFNVGYVQVSGNFENTGVINAGSSDYSALIGGTLSNFGKADFEYILNTGSTIQNNAAGEFSADAIYMLGGKLANAASEDETVADGAVTIGSLVAVGNKNEDGTNNEVVNNSGDVTITGNAVVSDVLEQVLASDVVAGSEILSGLADSLKGAADQIVIGHVQMNGALENSGNFTVEDGISAVVGSDVNNSGKISYADLVAYGSSVNNEGTFEAGNLLSVGSTIANAENAEINVSGVAAIVGTGEATNVVNNGTINTEGGLGLAQVLDAAQLELNLSEALKQVEVGSVVANGAVENNGVWNASGSAVIESTVTNAENGAINLSGHMLAVNSRIDNAGSIASSGAIVSINGEVVNNGEMATMGGIRLGDTVSAEFSQIDLGYAQLGGSAVNNGEWKASAALVADGSFENAEGAKLEAGSVTVAGTKGSLVNNSVINADILTGTAQAAVTNNSVVNAGILNVNAGATLENNSEANASNVALSVSGNIVNNGVLNTVGGISLEDLEIEAIDTAKAGSIAQIEVGYAQIGGETANNAEWNASTALVIEGKVENNQTIDTEALVTVNADIVNNAGATVTISGNDQLDALAKDVLKDVLEQAGADLDLTVGLVQVGGTLANSGTIDAEAAGLSGLIGGKVANEGSMKFNDVVASNGVIGNSGEIAIDNLVASGSRIENTGKFAVQDELRADKTLVDNASEMTVGNTVAFSGSVLQNKGTFEAAQQVAVSNNGGIDNSGVFSAQSLVLTGSALANQEAASVAVEGSVKLDAATIANAGKFVAGNVDAIGSTITNGAEFVAGAIDLNNSSFENVAGKVSADRINVNTASSFANKAQAEIGFLTVDGKAQSSGSLAVSDKTDLTAGASLEISGGSFTNSGSLIGEGVVSVSGDKTVTVIKGDVEGFTGTIDVAGGLVQVEQGGYNGAFTLSDGRLETGIGNVFVNAEDRTDAFLGGEDTVSSGEVALKNEGSVFTGGTLAITDKGYYNGTLLSSVGALMQDGSRLEWMNSEFRIDKTEGDNNDVALDGIDFTTDNLDGAEDFKFDNGEFRLEAKKDDAGNVVDFVNKVGSMTFGSGADVVIASGVKLDLGSLSVADGVDLVINDGVNIDLGILEGAGDIVVGDLKSGGATVTVDSVEMKGGSIFIDPFYGNSVFEVDTFNNVVATDLVVGNNGILTIAASAAEAEAAFGKLGIANNFKSYAYVAEDLTVDSSTGALVVDQALTAMPTVKAGEVTVGAGSALIIDQSAGSITTSGDLTNNGTIGIVNANVGDVITAASSSGNGKVLSDNRFIAVEMQNGKVVGSIDKEKGLGALASMGIQAMVQQADQQLSQSIADRMAFGAKSGLWVDVASRNTKADKFDNGGEFDADMGYGTFGAQHDFGNGFSLGAAMQYGSGDLDSEVEGISNSVENIGFAVYGARDFGDVRLVGEFSVVNSKNEVASVLNNKINQTVDSHAYSVGLTAHYTYRIGALSFVPSFGLKATRIETDPMQIGAVRIGKLDQNILQMPIALRIGGLDVNANGWNILPSVKFSWIPSLFDDEIEVINAKQSVLDMNPIQMDVGLGIIKDGLSVNANMIIGGGDNGSASFGGKIGVRYDF